MKTLMINGRREIGEKMTILIGKLLVKMLKKEER